MSRVHGLNFVFFMVYESILCPLHVSSFSLIHDLQIIGQRVNLFVILCSTRQIFHLAETERKMSMLIVGLFPCSALVYDVNYARKLRFAPYK